MNMIKNSIIIIYGDDRKKNLFQMLRFLIKDNWVVENSELIVVAQNSEVDLFGFKEKKLINCKDEKYRRNKMINKGVLESKGELLTILDSDRILPIRYIKNIYSFIQENQCVTTKNLWQMEKEFSDEDIEKGNYSSRQDFRSEQNCQHKKGTFSGNTVLTKKCFLDCGLMDESYVGYGYNDIDCSRTMIKNKKEMIFLDDKELHLFHEKKESEEEVRISTVKNGIKYCKKWGLKPEDLLIQNGRKVNIDVEKEIKKIIYFT
ncbi:MAG: glycosyltransferase family 2 protein [Neisseriaceae bacterium]|nr:MAG: glycosyltransferase family 2 protein [Neisseriaceae bacterium]